MSQQLGTLEDLPEEYRAAMTEAGVAPLWPMMRNVLPHGAPNPVTKPGYWNYDAIRPLLIQAGELTPVEKAERRVLVLSDPGRGAGAMQATASIYLGLQLLLPGETAPAHVHTPSAVRIVVEGKGGFTVVDGEKLPMEEGDLVLTLPEWPELAAATASSVRARMAVALDQWSGLAERRASRSTGIGSFGSICGGVSAQYQPVHELQAACRRVIACVRVASRNYPIVPEAFGLSFMFR